MADLFIIGQFEGTASITAVSIGSQIMHMITVMLVGLAMGVTVGIGRAQSGVLNYILVESARRPLCQRDIEQEFGLRPSTATGLLKALEEQGLIERRPDEKDGRCKRIVFLEKAEAIRQTLRGEVEGTEQLLTKGITPEEQREFLRIARKMLENLDGAGESGPAEQEEQ